MLDNVPHQLLRIHDAMLFWYHAASDGQHRPKDADVEQHGAVLGDFEVQEGVWIEDGEEDEDRGERSS